MLKEKERGRVTVFKQMQNKQTTFIFLICLPKQSCILKVSEIILKELNLIEN